MAGTTVFEGYPAEEVVVIPGIVNGNTYTTRMSAPFACVATMRDATYAPGTANILTTAISGRVITFTIAGYTAGTADLIIKGRT